MGHVVLGWQTNINQPVYIGWFHEQKVSGKFNSPSLSITILSYLNSLQHSHLTTTALTTAHPKIPQTVMKQDVNTELLYCPWPPPMSFSFPLVPSWIFVHCSLGQYSVKQELSHTGICREATGNWLLLQRSLLKYIYIFKRNKMNISPSKSLISANSLDTCCLGYQQKNRQLIDVTLENSRPALGQLDTLC